VSQRAAGSELRQSVDVAGLVLVEYCQAVQRLSDVGMVGAKGFLEYRQ
jgi:hypothetical protein